MALFQAKERYQNKKGFTTLNPAYVDERDDVELDNKICFNYAVPLQGDVDAGAAALEEDILLYEGFVDLVKGERGDRLQLLAHPERVEEAIRYLIEQCPALNPKVLVRKSRELAIWIASALEAEEARTRGGLPGRKRNTRTRRGNRFRALTLVLLIQVRSVLTMNHNLHKEFNRYCM